MRRIVVVNGKGEGELDGFWACALAVHATGEVAEGEGQVVGAGLGGEAEGLGFAVGALCPDFVELKGLVAILLGERYAPLPATASCADLDRRAKGFAGKWVQVAVPWGGAGCLSSVALSRAAALRRS